MGFFDKIKAGLTKTREALSGTLGSVFSGFSEIDDDFYDELEESLILADLGVDTSVKAVGRLRKAVREQHLKTTEEAREALKEILVDMLSVGDTELNLSTHPSVILVIGVNGVGKTTTIGKIAKQLTSQGKKVMLVAGDTFRAAAADQLEIWAGRSGASIVRQHEGADPASVVFDGIQSAKARDVDVILIDTAGRLHNKTNLMNELNKISRIVARELPDAAKEVLLVLDGTTGQNGLIQAKQFKEIAGVTAIALTKLDVLSSMKQIPVITGYKLDDVEVPRFDTLSDLDRVQPVVTLLPGWNKDISGCRSWAELPKEAKAYVEFLEKQLGHEIQFVSTGAEREKFVLKGEWL